jgi:hypothetical protein
MTAAGASHWWSVNQWVSNFPAGLPAHAEESMTRPAGPLQAKSVASTLALAPAPSQKALTPDPAQKNFYEVLVKKMESLQNQNRDLSDQVAETNRDMMKLEFRVDTHSESFRPMPASEDRPDTSFDNGPGVLPPRAEPVSLGSNE